VDLKNRYLGTGSSSLSIERIATSHGSAEGFRHATLVTEDGERLNAQVTESLRAASFGGETVKDLTLEMAIRDWTSAASRPSAACLATPAACRT
jgi:hypothetical protein